MSLQVLESAYRDERNQSGFSWQQQYFTLRRMRGISVFAACGQLFPLGTGEYLHLPSRQLFPVELLPEPMNFCTLVPLSRKQDEKFFTESKGS